MVNELFQLVFLWWFSGQVSLCINSLRIGFPFLGSIVFLCIFPIGFSKPGIWVLISLLQYLEACVPDVAFESFIHLEERSVPLKSLSIVNYCIWSVGFSLVSLYLHLPYWSHWCSFNLFCGSFMTLFMVKSFIHMEFGSNFSSSPQRSEFPWILLLNNVLLFSCWKTAFFVFFFFGIKNSMFVWSYFQINYHSFINFNVW